MAIRDRRIFYRALRAAAGVTGVLKRQGVALAATVALTGAACGTTTPPQRDDPAPSEETHRAAHEDADGDGLPDWFDGRGGDFDAARVGALSDAELDELQALGDCTMTDGTSPPKMDFGSDCCVRYRDLTGAQIGPAGCTPWGPPAPPAYAGGVLA